MTSILFALGLTLLPRAARAGEPVSAATGTVVAVSSPSMSLSVSVSTPPAVETVDSLLKSLESEEDPGRRVRIIRELDSDERRGAASLRALADRMLNDLSDQVREAAAAAVISYPGSESIELLDKFLAQEQGPTVRRDICLELSTAPAHKSSPEITGLLTRVLVEDAERDVRVAALQAISLREDRRALEALKRAAAAEPDESLRRQIKDVLEKLKRPPKVAASARKRPPRVSPDAVKGAVFCGDGNGWCECSLGPLHPKSRCITRDECTYLYENSYMRQGYRCTWDGGSLTGE